jgi:acetyl-CoA carboxylase beta subunit
VVEQDRKREDEWFLANEKRLLETARIEREKREKDRAAQTADVERKRLREQHFMRCPKCGHEMKEEELQGVKIDRCSFCEGIYFDAGELDQVLLKREDDRRGFFRKLVKI